MNENDFVGKIIRDVDGREYHITSVVNKGGPGAVYRTAEDFLIKVNTATDREKYRERYKWLKKRGAQLPKETRIAFPMAILEEPFVGYVMKEAKGHVSLNDYVENEYVESKNNYLFIDEVQMCEGFEKTLNSLHESGKYDIYVTGSNAFLLSSDLATLFTGRTFSIEVFPFSLKDYMEYYELTDAYEAYTLYRKMGGMSGSYLYTDENSRASYVNDVFETLVIRDTVQKYKIRNTPLLEKIVDYLMDENALSR